MTKPMKGKNLVVIDNNCKQRIKPQLLRDVKTEAVLVFARTALERFFQELDSKKMELTLGSQEDTEFIYGSLRDLLKKLQMHVVNVEYLIEVVQAAKRYPMNLQLKQLSKYEDPLIKYYDTLAMRIEYNFPSKMTVLPEFIVICVLSHWFLENEKSMGLYPFLEKYDFIQMIEKFELYGQKEKDTKRKVILQMQQIASDVVTSLVNKKYQAGKKVSKRKRRK